MVAMIFKTYKKALLDVAELNRYIKLVEEYETHTINRFIIKSYAETNSVPKVIQKINNSQYAAELPTDTTNSNYILNVIKSKAQDDLHKIVQKIYLNKTKRRSS